LYKGALLKFFFLKELIRAIESLKRASDPRSKHFTSRKNEAAVKWCIYHIRGMVLRMTTAAWNSLPSLVRTVYIQEAVGGCQH